MGRTFRGKGKHRSKPRRCPVHRGQLVGWATRWGIRYECAEPDCDVIQWSGSTSTPADGRTRKARRFAHAVYDPLWRGGGLNRDLCYKFLARFMGMSKTEAHIGMFDYDQCQRVQLFVVFVGSLMEQVRLEKAATGVVVDIRTRIDQAMKEYEHAREVQSNRPCVCGVSVPRQEGPPDAIDPADECSH